MHCSNLNIFVNLSLNILIKEPYIYVYATRHGKNIKRRLMATLFCSPRRSTLIFTIDGELDVKLDLDDDDTPELVRKQLRMILVQIGFAHAGRPREKI